MSKEKILRILIDRKQPITSKMFARYLDVSSRTVINYISEINQSQNKNVITSGHLGYSASIDEIVEILKEMQQDSDIPQNFNERSTYIIKELLFKKRKPNVYDFALELYVSVSTLKNDIVKTNKIYKKYNCPIKYDDDNIFISGDYNDERALSAFIIRKETVGSLMDLNILKDVFDDLHVSAIKDSLDKVLKKHSLEINDYAYMNLLLHLSIIVDNAASIYEKNKQPDFSGINNLTKELCQSIYSKTGVVTSLYQNEQIENMLNIHFLSLSTSSEINKRIIPDDVTLSNSKKICKRVNDIFSIDICNEDFLLPFSLHLERLIIRMNAGYHEKNPMTKLIKSDNPIIYEVAVYIVSIIIDIYDLNEDYITEDEIAFIALHVGSAVSKSYSSQNKLKAIIISPEYHDIRENLVKSIYSSFHNELIIKKVVSFPNEVEESDYDILIKTVPDDIFMTDNSVLIDLLDYDKNKLLIQDKITNINNINNTKLLINRFDEIFIKELFMKTDEIYKDKYQVINFLGEKMVDLNIIDNSHLDNILKRESLSSTAFDNIAIPHALKLDAKKTSISVLISNKGIRWDDSIVNIIMMIAISPDNLDNFKSIYEGLLALFKDENIPYIAKIFKEYKDIKKFFKETNKFVT